MKRYLGIVCLVPLFFLQSCFPAFKFELEGLEPAEFIISPGVNSLTVLSRVDLDSLFKAGYLTSGKKVSFSRDSAIAKEAVLGCVDALIESPRFEVFDPVIKRTLVGDFSDANRSLPWSILRSVAGNPPLDAVLSLESGEIKDTVVAKSDNGWLFFEENIIVKSHWRLYFLREFAVSTFVFLDTLFFNLGTDNVANVTVSLSSEKQLAKAKEAMYLAGQHTGRRLAPYWTDLDRIYFPYGQEEFNKAAKAMREGRWESAAQTWNLQAKSRSKSLAARASFNMALTCEMAGNIPMALEWLKESEKNGMEPYYIRDYMTKLKERQTKNQRIDMQMNKQR